MSASRAVPLLLAGLLTVGALSACQDEESPTPPEDGIREYVALGDSYAAAPHFPADDLSVPCSRSDDNYPALVAEQLSPIHLDDVSCVGATSASMTGAQVPGGRVPPQLDALSEDTDLVTLTIGGNDEDLFQSWLGCFKLKEADPKGSPCADAQGATLLDLMPEIQRNIEAVLAEVQRRAPDAAVIVVTYPQVFPDRGTCELASAYARGDHAYINSIVKSLGDALIAAAKAAGVAAVDLYAASSGHDVCSQQPWVNGSATDTTRANPLHPFPEEQAAVARLILDRVVLPSS